MNIWIKKISIHVCRKPFNVNHINFHGQFEQDFHKLMNICNSCHVILHVPKKKGFKILVM